MSAGSGVCQNRVSYREIMAPDGPGKRRTPRWTDLCKLGYDKCFHLTPQSTWRGGPGPRGVGAWPSGKAPAFGAGIRRFESFRPNQFSLIATNMRPTGFGELKVFSGSAHPQLAAEIAEFLGVELGQARLRRFPDTEVSFQIDENIRGTDVFIVQPTCAPVDSHLMELMIMIDAFRRSSAARITAVIPYYCYARQDRKDKPRVPISAKLVANLLVAAGTHRVLTMDLHKAQIQGFFDLPVDHLFAAPVIIDYLMRQSYERLTIVAPDAGGAERARAYAKRLDAELAVIDKRRSEEGTAEVMNVIGEVSGRTCVIADDIIDTAGTIQKAADALMEAGAERVLACAIHGVLSGPAIERIEKAPIDKLIITNTIPLTADRAKCQKILQLPVGRLLGQAIRSIHEETSVSSLFV